MSTKDVILGFTDVLVNEASEASSKKSREDTLPQECTNGETEALARQETIKVMSKVGFRLKAEFEHHLRGVSLHLLEKSIEAKQSLGHLQSLAQQLAVCSPARESRCSSGDTPLPRLLPLFLV